jgi:ABC-2 type transport system permease protein
MSNRFYLLITIVGLVFYIGIYFVLPADLDEKLSLAMYAPVVPPVFSQLTGHEGVDIEYFTDEEALQKAVLDGKYQVAVSLPPDIMQTWAAGGKPE